MKVSEWMGVTTFCDWKCFLGSFWDSFGGRWFVDEMETVSGQCLKERFVLVGVMILGGVVRAQDE